VKSAIPFYRHRLAQGTTRNQIGQRDDDDIGHVPHTVTATPVMLRGVSWSPKNHAETLIVATSLAMPAIDIGTTPARWRMLATRQIELVRKACPNFKHILEFAQYHEKGNNSWRNQKESRVDRRRYVGEKLAMEYCRPIIK
jgi:hypothetical protein